MKLPVITLDNEPAGEVEADDGVFGVEVRKDLLARCVNWQLAKRRAGTHKTKGVSEISGTGKKPYRQKGTGRARQGSMRSSQFRGGQTTFGPVVRSHAHDLPKKVRKAALRCALSAKAKDGKLIILDGAKMDSPKTSDMVKRIKALGWDSVLFVDNTEVDFNFGRSIANIPRADAVPQIGANVYDILRRDTLALTKDALQALEARLK